MSIVKKVTDTIARVKTLALAVNTYLIAFAAAAPVLANAVADSVPGPFGEKAKAVILAVAGVAASIVLVIRRSTEVVPEDRQILPLKDTAGNPISPIPASPRYLSPAPGGSRRSLRNWWGGWG